MGISWKINRLKGMDRREIAFRVLQTGRVAAERVGLFRARLKNPVEGSGLPWVASLPTRFPVELYRQQADGILGGKFRLFSMNQANLGFPPQWNRDASTGTSAPLVFGKTLNYRDERVVGNIKFLWEPNRHLELVTLAQAWHLSGERKYAVGCRSLLQSWFSQCPYLMGPNWTSSLELGIRLVNWSFAWHLLGGSESWLFDGEEGALFKRRWLASIYQHCHFIEHYPSLFSSANNHRLGEQLGLYIATTTWPLWPESREWLLRAAAALERAALEQNGADGVNREQAVWYHHEVADMLLLAGLVGRANGVAFGSQFWRRLEDMLVFLASIMDAGGNVPAIGDSDDAVIVRFCSLADFCVYRSLLATGAVLFGREDFKLKAVVFDDKTRWLLGDRAEEDFLALRKPQCDLPARQSFPVGGYYILGSDFETPSEVRVIADAGPLGYLAIAAHGHADALSFVLSAGGQPILIDPGTYAYHTESDWRGYFRGTSAHNTIRVDGEDQSISGGPFLWTRHAETICEHFEYGPRCQSLVASHDGYRRLADPVTHRRKLAYRPATRTLVVEDFLECNREHAVEMHWHFEEHCRIAMFSQHALISHTHVVVKLTWPASSRAFLVREQTSPPLGWRSHQFGSKTPCWTIAVREMIFGQWAGLTKFEVTFVRNSS